MIKQIRDWADPFGKMPLIPFIIIWCIFCHDFTIKNIKRMIDLWHFGHDELEKKNDENN